MCSVRVGVGVFVVTVSAVAGVGVGVGFGVLLPLSMSSVVLLNSFPCVAVAVGSVSLSAVAALLMNHRPGQTALKILGYTGQHKHTHTLTRTHTVKANAKFMAVGPWNAVKAATKRCQMS